jgi:hypothetical protein
LHYRKCHNPLPQKTASAIDSSRFLGWLTSAFSRGVFAVGWKALFDHLHDFPLISQETLMEASLEWSSREDGINDPLSECAEVSIVQHLATSRCTLDASSRKLEEI